MTLSQNDVDAAAVEVIRDKLAHGVGYHEVEMVLNGLPGSRTYSVEELGQVRKRVVVMFRTYTEAIKPERAA